MNTQLSFSLIFSQTINFVKNRFLQIIIVCVLLGILSNVLSDMFLNQAILNEVVMMSDVQTALPLLSKLLLILLTISFVTNSIMIAAVYNLSRSAYLNPQMLISRLLPILLNILGFFIIYVLISILAIVILSLALFLIGFIFPSLGSTLSLLGGLIILIGMMTVFYLFVGSLVDPSTKSFFTLFLESHHFAKKCWKSSVLMVLISLLVITVITALEQVVANQNIFISTLFISLSNLVNIFVIVYFYRSYQLVSEQHSPYN